MIRQPGKLITVTPAIASFVTQYSSGDVLGGVTTVSNAVLDDGGFTKLISIVVTDATNQKAAIDLVFFSQAPANSVGADNAAYGLNDADLPYVLGRITVASADYVSSGSNNAEATLKNLQLLCQAAVKTKDIFVLPVSRDTPTYGSATALKIRMGFEAF